MLLGLAGIGFCNRCKSLLTQLQFNNEEIACFLPIVWAASCLKKFRCSRRYSAYIVCLND